MPSVCANFFWAGSRDGNRCSLSTFSMHAFRGAVVQIGCKLWHGLRSAPPILRATCQVYLPPSYSMACKRFPPIGPVKGFFGGCRARWSRGRLFVRMGIQSVAQAVDRADDLFPGEMRCNFLAQILDVGIDGSIVAFEIVSLNDIDQFVP